MAYQRLDLQSVIEYVRQHPHAARAIDPATDLCSEEIGDGNLNMVFRVWEKERPERSILVKQGLPFLRVAGEGWPLSAERADFEARALAQHAAAAPGLVPQPYWHDPEMAVNAMQDLRGYAVIRAPMIARTRFANLGAVIGEFLAATLYATSDFALSSPEKRRLMLGFANAELCELTEALILTEPFYPPPNRNNCLEGLAPALADLQADPEVRRNVAHLKLKFMTQAQALLHGDLHTGSIMATPPAPQGQAEIRVIDPEFAFFGPMGFDIGLFAANLLLNAIAQGGHASDLAERQAYQRYLLEQLQVCWQTFEAGFRSRLAQAGSPSWREPAFQDEFLRSVLRDTVGFAGCELIRRTVGFAHVRDFDSVEPESARVLAGEANLALGRTLIKTYTQVQDISELLGAARQHLQLPAEG